jgi:hypothetical protein
MVRGAISEMGAAASETGRVASEPGRAASESPRVVPETDVGTSEQLKPSPSSRCKKSAISPKFQRGKYRKVPAKFDIFAAVLIKRGKYVYARKVVLEFKG